MEVLRYKYIIIVLTLVVNYVSNESSTPPPNTPNCTLSKIIEDMFKGHNKTNERGIYLEDKDRLNLFLNSIANISRDNTNKKDEDLINDIIASINRIKNNISNSTDKLNEAIILPPKIETASNMQENRIKSGIEEKIDTINHYDTTTKDITIKTEQIEDSTTKKTEYVEILTIEPNNTQHANTSYNLIEILKHLMPLFNSSLMKNLHNITIIEKDNDNTFSGSKNVSTIIVTYCDKENNSTEIYSTTALDTETDIDDYHDSGDVESDDDKATNITIGQKRDILEAAEYGMQKMHELYSVLEPKLYSMGLWLDDTNPARYVAAFNAPTEEVAKFSRYGYASLQAATRLKQLTSGNGESLEGRTEEVQFPTASALRQSPLMQHCPLRRTPKCPPASKRYRTHDGTCNNLNRPKWGSTMTPVQRFLPASYSDGLQAPRRSIFGSKLPSARLISSTVHENKNAESTAVTHLLMQWGQFVDHDVTSSSQSRGFNGSVPRCCKDGGRDFIPKEFMHPECFPIAVPASDPFYGPRGIRCLDFIRSSPAPRDDCALGWREQINQVSAYLDGSPLYGSSAQKSDKLRLFRNGMLQYGRVQQRRPVLPPERRDELCRGGAVSTDCFKSGDARVNEHPGLVAAHIVWLRQHNRMAQELAHLNPQWSDEKIYQEARKIVGAMIQHITYREFLPIVLGSEVMRRFELELQKKGYYKGYNPKMNPSPASSFGSAAFRFGHSLVQSSMMRFDRFHRPMKNNVSLHNELTNPSNIWSMGAVDRLLLGMVNQPIQNRDEFITEELTNHLFQTPQVDFGMDLAAINIQRGRDHGTAPYTSWREPCGLSAILNFEDLFRVMPARSARKMKDLYRHVDDIDLFTGGMAERPVMGGLVGPTFACIIAQQFSNLRKGDRFWYENGGFDSSFTPAQLQQIRRITFAQVLCRTLDTIDTIQPFVFLSTDNPDNDRISCQNGLLNNFDLSPWVELESDSNNDIKNSDDESSNQTTKTKPTTSKPKTTTKFTTNKPKTTKPTKKPPQDIVKVNEKDTATENDISTKNFTKDVETDKLTNLTKNAKDNDEINLSLPNELTKQTMAMHTDDKLSFKNKTRRVDDSKDDSRYGPTKKYDDNDYDDDDDTQSVQSVVINNVLHKRPYNRPVITVTENINKYTYLINYVPRPTQSWRRTTRRTHDRDVVKVTYQTYDDTYKRPYKPHYYKTYEKPNYRLAIPTYKSKQNDYSSGRSNDESTTNDKPTKNTKTDGSTTENLYKLVTFGYVGTYKGESPGVLPVTDDKSDTTKKNTKKETISKDFSTYDDKSEKADDKSIKLSTFYMYDTATKPYNLHRPTRRSDEKIPVMTDKYYYIRNVLHKYNYTDTTVTPISTTNNNIIKENYNNPGNSYDVEERSAADKIAFLEDIDIRRDKTKNKPKPNSAKTPSVAFQVIPSENSPSQWAIYDEEADLPDYLPYQMPIIKTDPYALKEFPTPINFANFKRRGLAPGSN